jgi:hypothetical protein
MVLRRRVTRGVRIHFDPYKFYHASSIPNKGRIPGKIVRVQTGSIPSWTYSKADVYRDTTVDGSHQPQKQAHLQSNPSASSTMDYSDINTFGEWNIEEEADDQINKTHSWQTVNNKRRRIRSQTTNDSTEQFTITDSNHFLLRTETIVI